MTKPPPYAFGLRVEIDDTGRLLVFGGDGMPGLFLASSDHDAIWRDLGMALKYLLLRNHHWPHETRPAFATVN